MGKNSPFAREGVMQEYLDSLLRAPEDPADVTANTAKLLEDAARRISEESTVPLPPDEDGDNADVVQSFDAPEADTPDTTAPAQQQPALSQQDIAATPVASLLDEQFQALFFEVAGLTLAVPLITLGGIHQLEKVGPLFGKPSWFKGVMLHRDEKLNVVDTAQWVMPEKYDQSLADALHYRYLIMLGESEWGLASENLVNTVTLSKADVKWREAQGKRPWLAGMVKERMCALIDVYQLIAMLNNGLGSNDQTP
ncbi:chemotaxis protein CheW [Alteromonas halophila]|uniref:CheW-like domain-containing protein n=1 Tax=Alteromonas halophila TaxID=516698 RepID=A0A918MVH7_9ALTE|nr:chemotaxis protein CheW [Alteromonas halophila]GGW73803.1 hypothetical protein GCM10007391_01870 [Alteromonas halophila]